MANFEIPDKDLLTSVDRAADSILIYDNSASELKRTTVDYALDLTSHPVGIDDTQTLTLKTLTAPAISDPVLSGTVTGTYTLGGTPTFPAAVVTLTGTQTLTNKTLTAPTITTATIANPTLTVDTVSEHTGANGVTVDGLNIKDGKLNTANSVVATNITDAIITNAKLSTTAGELGGAWLDWVPTFANLSGGTLTYARYLQTGKTIRFRILYTLTGANVSGAVTFTPPVPVGTYFNQGIGGIEPIGSAALRDAGTAIIQGTVLIDTLTTMRVQAMNAAATYVVYNSFTSTVPFTWASGDSIGIEGAYEAA